MCGILVSTDVQIEMSDFESGLDVLRKRGPDDRGIMKIPEGIIGFQRLAIMGVDESGMQPFVLNDRIVVCNGELYGFRPIKKELEKEYTFKSESDCEIILPLYEKYGLKMFSMLDAEFAMVIYDGVKKEWIAARDPIGIRPLFYGYTKDNRIAFGSLAASLMPFCKEIHPFPIGSCYYQGKFIRYEQIEKTESFVEDPLDTACYKMRDYLVEGVKKRMDSDSKIGYLLSGGLDSSLVCAIAQKMSEQPIHTYSIGMETDAIDLKYARKVADYISSNHTEVIITKKDVIDALEEVIVALESWDITTIRASIGMYLLCKKIKETGDVKVILTGEISDELFGYKYTDFAPNAAEFQKEAEKRIRELYMYDVLRADRCISANSLEGRVPFGDLDFVRYVMSVDPELKFNKYQMGKYLLRHAFEEDQILPEEILWRDKAAFSDAVGHSLVDILKEYAEEKYTDEEFDEKKKKYTYRQPYTKESLLYREIFEKYYPGMADMIVDYWLPNQEWEGCKVNDPSARYLSNYGKSGE